MKCPACGCEKSQVIDSRPIEENNSIKRRRECLGCRTRFTTYEVIDQMNPFVIKKDGSREIFDKNKLLTGLYKACEKRPISAATQDKLVEDITRDVYNTLASEVSTASIGEIVMNNLKKVDEVAYVRFASVYREFKDTQTFMAELQRLLDEKN